MPDGAIEKVYTEIEFETLMCQIYRWIFEENQSKINPKFTYFKKIVAHKKMKFYSLKGEVRFSYTPCLEVIHDKIPNSSMATQTRNDTFRSFDYLHIK